MSAWVCRQLPAGLPQLAFGSWYRILKGREYRSPHELRADFPTASFLEARRTIFNIGGNKFRLVVDMRYDLGWVYVRDVLTHEECDQKSIEGTL